MASNVSTVFMRGIHQKSVSWARLSRWEESNSHHRIVPNTQRVWCFNGSPAFSEHVQTDVHTCFIRRPAAEYATQKPDGNLTRLSPPV